MTLTLAAKSGWRKGIANWKIGNTLYISVPFTWLMKDADDMASQHKGDVVIGGPGTMRPSYCEAVEPILFHNPLATFTTRGCPNQCQFCAVPVLEGDFTQYDTWRHAPIICDNNLLAGTMKHFSNVVQSLKRFRACDFNQGLDARLFKPEHADLLATLKNPKIRFAFDHVNVETTVHDAVCLAIKSGLKDIGVYVLIGFRDTPEDALYRLEKVRSWGIWPNPMRYQPLNTTEKNSYVAPGWDERNLRKTMKYYSRLAWLDHIPFKDFEYKEIDYRQESLC